MPWAAHCMFLAIEAGSLLVLQLSLLLCDNDDLVLFDEAACEVVHAYKSSRLTVRSCSSARFRADAVSCRRKSHARLKASVSS